MMDFSNSLTSIVNHKYKKVNNQSIQIGIEIKFSHVQLILLILDLTTQNYVLITKNQSNLISI